MIVSINTKEYYFNKLPKYHPDEPRSVKVLTAL